MFEIDLLKFCWKHKLFSEDSLVCSNGKDLRIADCGLLDSRPGTPSFFNAKLKIGNNLWVGSVEVLEKASQWKQRNLDKNLAYKNVILVVCEENDAEIVNCIGETIPVLEAKISSKIEDNFWSLIDDEKGRKLCHSHIMDYTTMLSRRSWLAAMQTEWLEKRCEEVSCFYNLNSNFDEAMYASIFHGFGYGVNCTAMDLLARALPMECVLKCRSNLFQIEALVLGQAGLLEVGPGVQCALVDKFKKNALMEGYFAKLRNEYLFLKNRFNLSHCMSHLVWEPFGKGYLVYPHVILSMLANWLYTNLQCGFCNELVNMSVEELYEVFNIRCTPYWESHYNFGAKTAKHRKNLSKDRISFAIIDAIVPTIFFYGRTNDSEKYCDYAFDVMELTKNFYIPERTSFEKKGFFSESAEQTIAMMYLNQDYCHCLSHNRCLDCRFGYAFIKMHKS